MSLILIYIAATFRAHECTNVSHTTPKLWDHGNVIVAQPTCDLACSMRLQQSRHFRSHYTGVLYTSHNVDIREKTTHKSYAFLPFCLATTLTRSGPATQVALDERTSFPSCPRLLPRSPLSFHAPLHHHPRPGAWCFVSCPHDGAFFWGCVPPALLATPHHRDLPSSPVGRVWGG